MMNRISIRFWDAAIELLGFEPPHTGSYEVLKQVALFAVVVLLQYLLIRLTRYIFRRLKKKADAFQSRFFRPLFFRQYEFLGVDKQERIISFFLKTLQWVVIILQFMITIPLMFSIFPQTESLAVQLFSYIFTPLKNIFWGIIHYIPNLFIILIIGWIIRSIVRGLAYFANEIEKGTLKIKGFYADWAQPTYSIIRFLLYAFMLALIWPYLPHSDSGIFQGISIFIGVLVSFGSSTAIGNLIAGLIITYMRPFHIGDRIKINEIIGNVMEKTPVVTRIRTLKNEIVTIPNAAVISAQTTNLSESARTTGLILPLVVTAGYDADWRQVHRLLIEAAQDTPGVMADPQPFVLETAFNDWNISYEINAYIDDADRLMAVQSGLRQNIQDRFREAGISILSAHYFSLKTQPGD